MGDGLMAHTLYEDRDLNSSQDLFDGVAGIKTDPEMVQVAAQLVQRQAGKYDLEADVSEVSTSNVVDLMAALKKSLGQSSADRPAWSKRKKTEDARQTGLKLPIKGGKAAVERVDAQAATKPSRKRA